MTDEFWFGWFVGVLTLGFLVLFVTSMAMAVKG